MFQSSILRINQQGTQQATAEERLWRAVITKSLRRMDLQDR